jgi:hypothetical protein
MGSRDSSVDITIGSGLVGRGSIPARGKKLFSTTQLSDRLWDPPSLLSRKYRGAFSLGVKRSGFEAKHSPPSTAEVKIDGALPHTS